MSRIPPVSRLRSAAALAALAMLASPEARQAPTAPVQILKSVAALPAHVAVQFQQLTSCRQNTDGVYFVFDRRAHSVYTAPPTLERAQKLIEIGTEPGRVIDPTAFDLGPDNTFAVADAPSGRPRVQIFTTSGSTLNGFYLQGRAVPRIMTATLVLSGLGAIEYVGRSLYLNQPELGALIAEYRPDGTTARTFGALRRTGHETERDLHLAFNSGLVVSNPAGGFYFVFLAGVPQFRKYDADGRLVFERHIEGIEMDQFIQELPSTWKRMRTDEGEVPLVLPSVYAAAADSSGSLWVSLPVGVTYVYSPAGDKRRTVAFHAAGRISPTGLSFTPGGRVLVTPGCYAFDPR